VALSAEILALNAAAQTRRWPWVALLVAAGYLTLVAIFVSMSQQCFDDPSFVSGCPPPDQLRQALLALGYLVTPLAALAWGINSGRAPWRRERALPEALVASSLNEEPQ
jgi:hypothetical protein